MEVSMSLNALTRLPLKNTGRFEEVGLARHSLFSSSTACRETVRMVFMVEAKGKKGMAARQYQRTPPPMPKIEDDGNPRFVIFIRMANVYLWHPLSIIAGGTTAKIMVAAKDNLLGKIYLQRHHCKKHCCCYLQSKLDNLLIITIVSVWSDSALQCVSLDVISDCFHLQHRMRKRYKRQQIKQHRVLRTATEFRYGYKLVENGNMSTALSTSDVIELPTQDQLKTVIDKVKDYFGDAKESFGKITSLNPGTDEKTEENPQ